jgi:hypothetical protein
MVLQPRRQPSSGITLGFTAQSYVRSTPSNWLHLLVFPSTYFLPLSQGLGHYRSYKIMVRRKIIISIVRKSWSNERTGRRNNNGVLRAETAKIKHGHQFKINLSFFYHLTNEWAHIKVSCPWYLTKHYAMHP